MLFLPMNCCDHPISLVSHAFRYLEESWERLKCILRRLSYVMHLFCAEEKNNNFTQENAERLPWIQTCVCQHRLILTEFCQMHYGATAMTVNFGIENQSRIEKGLRSCNAGAWSNVKGQRKTYRKNVSYFIDQIKDNGTAIAFTSWPGPDLS